MNENLEWEKNPSDKLMNWYEAVEYAKSLGESWRLPTIGEMQEVYNIRKEEFTKGYYWTSSTTDSNNGWFVNFAYASMIEYVAMDFSNKLVKLYVRCVKDVITWI
jgi:hypothetical protein